MEKIRVRCRLKEWEGLKSLPRLAEFVIRDTATSAIFAGTSPANKERISTAAEWTRLRPSAS
jgi:hypothetical protein